MLKTKVKNKEKVLVAMSGGVDSSVAAALLKKSGFNVMGVFMKFWMPLEKNGLLGKWNRCCSPEAEKRARKVAKVLRIPFYVFNFEKEFKKKIVDYFLKASKEGLTPNPCVVCNKEIKFGLLLERALRLGVGLVATGHYSCLRPRRLAGRRQEIKNQRPASPAGESKIKNYKLLRGKDKKKDQSYFLWQLNQKQLRHILFPVGDLTKKEVRILAKKFKLPVLNVPESQEVCFVPKTVGDFLAKYLKAKPGPIVEKVHTGASKIINRRVLGQHNGLHFYTIGQRKGIKISGGPWYALGKDVKNNTLIVTKDERDLEKNELATRDVNWISGVPPKLPLKIKAKIRYKSKLTSATINPTHRCISVRRNKKEGGARLVFKKPQRAITPGQSVVFYSKNEVLGGGIIC